MFARHPSPHPRPSVVESPSAQLVPSIQETLRVCLLTIGFLPGSGYLSAADQSRLLAQGTTDVLVETRQPGQPRDKEPPTSSQRKNLNRTASPHAWFPQSSRNRVRGRELSGRGGGP